MNNTFPMLNANGRPTMECHAHFPGTGPANEICSRCTLLEPAGSKFVCSKYQRLTGKKPKPISPGSLACKYFEKRRAFNSAPEV